MKVSSLVSPLALVALSCLVLVVSGRELKQGMGSMGATAAGPSPYPEGHSYPEGSKCPNANSAMGGWRTLHVNDTTAQWMAKTALRAYNNANVGSKVKAFGTKTPEVKLVTIASQVVAGTRYCLTIFTQPKASSTVQKSMGLTAYIYRSFGADAVPQVTSAMLWNLDTGAVAYTWVAPPPSDS